MYAFFFQYLEMIERFRDNNPKVYSRPLQKNVPTVGQHKAGAVRGPPQFAQPPPPPSAFSDAPVRRQTKSQPRERLAQERHDSPRTQAEGMGLVRVARKPDAGGVHRGHDMDYQEYMNIVNKVRKNQEFTRVRAEQLRLASMYAQEKQRQEELRLEEERLQRERELFERERTVSGNDNRAPVDHRTFSQHHGHAGQERGDWDYREAEQFKELPMPPARGHGFMLPNIPEGFHRPPLRDDVDREELLQQRQEQMRLEQLRRAEEDQRRKQELRELQVFHC